MNWILEHFQIVLAIAGAFAFWLKQRKEAKAETSEPQSRPTQPATMEEADDAERARKIREEILRKISERRGEPPRAPAASTPAEPRTFKIPPLVRPHSPLDTFGGPSRPVIVRAEPERTVPPVLVPKGESHEAVLARQERLAQQLRELEEKRASALRRATAEAEVKREVEGVWRRSAANVREELRDPRSLRHAMILREVLGTPVGLR